MVGQGLYVAGSTLGALPEGSSIGESDGFLVKFLPNGTEVWTRQFGTTDYDAVVRDGAPTRRAWWPWGPRTARSRARRTPATVTSSS